MIRRILSDHRTFGIGTFEALAAGTRPPLLLILSARRSCIFLILVLTLRAAAGPLAGRGVLTRQGPLTLSLRPLTLALGPRALSLRSLPLALRPRALSLVVLSRSALALDILTLEPLTLALDILTLRSLPLALDILTLGPLALALSILTLRPLALPVSILTLRPLAALSAALVGKIPGALALRPLVLPMSILALRPLATALPAARLCGAGLLAAPGLAGIKTGLRGSETLSGLFGTRSRAGLSRYPFGRDLGGRSLNRRCRSGLGSRSAPFAGSGLRLRLLPGLQPAERRFCLFFCRPGNMLGAGIAHML